MLKRAFLFFLVVCSSMLFAACLDKGNTDRNSGKLRVSASIVPLGDFASKIGGDAVDVTVVVPPGANPHVFEPSPGQLIDFGKSDVFVCVGAGFEFWKDKFIESSGRSDIEVVALSDGIDLIGGECSCGHEHSDGHGHSSDDHDSRGGNPHVWTSPALVAGFVPRLEKVFSEKDPANADVYKGNAAVLMADLRRLDSECRKAVSSFKTRKFMSQHAVWSYFAREYGLEEVGAIEKSPGKEPSPAEIESLIKTAKESGVSVIFADAQFSPKAAEAVSKDGNLKIVVLDAVGSSEGTGYCDMMRENLRRMSEVMR